MLVAVWSVPHADALRARDAQIEPVRSGDYKYLGDSPQPVVVVVEDARTREAFVWEKGTYGPGTQRFKPVFPDGGTNELAFLSESIAAELSKHGVPASSGPGTNGDELKLRVEDFDIRYHAGHSTPLNTFTHLRLVATYKGKSHVVSGYVVRSKHLFGSKKKLKQKVIYLYSDALHLVIREAAAKLSKFFWNLSASDTVVKQMAAALPQAPHNDTTMRVADLACSNNDTAADYLVKLVASPDQSERRLSLWGLGVLGTTRSVPLLEKAGKEGDAGEVLMALKSLADIGTPSARTAADAVDAARREGFSAYGVEELDAIRKLYR